MTMNSMTGFARGAGAAHGHQWNWEIKSVNNKGLDVRTRLPAFLDGYDLEVKKFVSSALSRGSIFVALNVETEEDEGALVVNERRLDALADIAAKFEGRAGVAPATFDGLLAVKGVLELTTKELSETELKELRDQLNASLKSVIDELKSARADEGARMQSVLTGQLDQIEALAKRARQQAGDRTQAMQDRFRQQLSKLENIEKPVPEERLVQELALLAVKADIQEELDRLDCHVEEARSLLAAKKPVGRRLDFLCQEFNREANTLCSKSGDSKLTKIGLDLKVLIDQFREQVQNIE